MTLISCHMAKSYLWVANAVTAGNADEVAKVLNPTPPRYTAGSLTNAIMDAWSEPLIVKVDQDNSQVRVLNSAESQLATFVPVFVEPSTSEVFE